MSIQEFKELKDNELPKLVVTDKTVCNLYNGGDSWGNLVGWIDNVSQELFKLLLSRGYRVSRNNRVTNRIEWTK